MTAVAAAALPLPTFGEFFRALWSRDPFPWQTMLAAQVTAEGWPEVIDLPTAAGKTACMEIALYALAAQSGLPAGQRSAPRRIWFVVDRRIVVDAAFERAGKIASALRSAPDGPLAAVAARLRGLSAGPEPRPLAVARLRGGIWRDDGWARLPAQPAVICSTVDQVGSALLFRAYGHGPNTAAIWAGLAANDSLILLDEAHCSRPFAETLKAVRRFREQPWCGQAPLFPFHTAIMSATHGAAEAVAPDKIFPPAAERAAALRSDELDNRINAAKPARLHPPVRGDRDALAVALTKAAKDFSAAGHRRIAVMVNRVATAQAVAAKLAQEPGARAGVDRQTDAAVRGEEREANAAVVLMTGRMRPLDRDDLVREWEPKLRAKGPGLLDRPVVLVTTQCLEVGADFDFDALATECASLDALRQRFGRLNRLGGAACCEAAIFVAEGDAKGKEPDPIYGQALAETWKWLNEIGRAAEGAVKEADFGIAAMDQALAGLRATDAGREATLYPPAEHAPVLLPAHLDMLCQTGPRPAVEPEPALFLHGPQAGPPEARVIWRVGLPAQDQADAEGQWQENLELLPPSSLEALTLPVYRLRRWLEGREGADEGGDVEGAAEPGVETGGEHGGPARRPFGLWRRKRREGALVSFPADPADIQAGDTVVLRAEEGGADGLGQLPPEENAQGLGPEKLDLAERAAQLGRGRIMLRAKREVLGLFADRPGIKALLALVGDRDAEVDRKEVAQALRQAAAEQQGSEGEAPARLPRWLGRNLEVLARDFAKDCGRAEPLPGGGLLLTAKKTVRPEAVEDDEDADSETGSSDASEPVTLRAHTAAVRRCAEAQAARCLPEEMTTALVWAAEHHDLGKLDRRFQLLLNDGQPGGEPGEDGPLAKSARVLRRWRRTRALAPEDELPKGFRHEMLSLAIAQAVETDLAPELHELALHLVASHHGHARPFAPMVADPMPEAAEIESVLADYFLPAGGAPVLDPEPAHRLGSGVADRFWRLARRYGWWGLAYLEAILRLADWQASAEAGDTEAEAPLPEPAPVRWAAPRAKPAPAEVELTAIDGSNPLGFLAALGTLRLVEVARPEVRLGMRWRPTAAGFRPVLVCEPGLGREEILDSLSKPPGLSEMFPAALLAAAEAAGPVNKKGRPGWKDKLKFPVAKLRECLLSAVTQPRADPIWLAAFVGEVGAQEKSGVPVAVATRFDFTAGNQAFVGMVRELQAAAGRSDLERAIFAGWRIRPGVSMCWDPEDEKRQYALQAFDPNDNTANPPRADPGANLLACYGLAFFPLAAHRAASQNGFDDQPGRRGLTWPLWSSPAGADTVRSLLSLPLGDAAWADAGILTALRSRIVTPSGRYRRFTQPEALWRRAANTHAQ